MWPSRRFRPCHRLKRPSARSLQLIALSLFTFLYSSLNYKRLSARKTTFCSFIWIEYENLLQLQSSFSLKHLRVVHTNSYGGRTHESREKSADFHSMYFISNLRWKFEPLSPVETEQDESIVDRSYVDNVILVLAWRLVICERLSDSISTSNWIICWEHSLFSVDRRLPFLAIHDVWSHRVFREIGESDESNQSFWQIVFPLVTDHASNSTVQIAIYWYALTPCLLTSIDV